MPIVTFQPGNKIVEVEAGATIIEAAKLAGLVIETPCNCNGTCRKCVVRIGDGSGEIVLACETLLFSDITVTISDSSESSSLKIIADGLSGSVNLDPAISKTFNEETDTTTVYINGSQAGSESGDTSGSILGIVVDIGTTTLVASLVDLLDGKELGSVSRLNPQALRAQDVLSRIKFAHTQDGLDVLCKDIIDQINEMVGVLCNKESIEARYIYEIVFSGNTCMLHLATGTDPTGLGKYPYTPNIRGGSSESAATHGIGISDFGVIYLPPIVSSYVGADITSGILVSELYDRPGNVLFVDIGTNGEVVLSKNGKLASTSTAAGPAFEGMNISCGMRAENGAIEEFDIDESGAISYVTIGNTGPVGICGSGLFDLVGELVNHGVLTKTGRFIRQDSTAISETLKQYIGTNEGKTAFYITDKVFLTQDDVRQVQLAKGAVRAGIEMLLDHSGITSDDLDEVLIAGSFGYHLRVESIINVGLLPKSISGRTSFLGNTSKTGGSRFLLDQSSRLSMLDVVANVDVIELANRDGFDRVFANCLGF